MRSFILRPLAVLLTLAVSLSLAWLGGLVWRSRSPVDLPAIKSCVETPFALINDLGEALARWSQRHGKTIQLDGQDINYVSVTEGGAPSTPANTGSMPPQAVFTVRWRSLSSTPPVPSPEWRALSQRVCKGACDERYLSGLIKDVSDPMRVEWITQEELADALGCLGKVSFVSFLGPGVPRLPRP